MGGGTKGMIGTQHYCLRLEVEHKVCMVCIGGSVCGLWVQIVCCVGEEYGYIVSEGQLVLVSGST